MLKNKKIINYFIVTIVFFVSCNDSSFKGDAGTSTPAKDTPQNVLAGPTQTDTTTAIASTNGNPNCVEGDFAKLSFPAVIQQCIDSGKIFNFSTNVCTNIRTASFGCTFSGISGALAGLGFSADQVTNAQNNNAKLVACGQSLDGNTIVAQWFYPGSTSGVNCQYSGTGSMIVTACYRHQVGSTPVVNPTTEAEIAAEVLRCMSENAN